jgi:hypothetical protein
VTGDEAFREDALRLGAEMVARFERHGSWFPDEIAADRHNLSAVTGLGAIALAFLRVQDPAVGSLRLLD